MKTAFFGAKPYEKPFFNEANSEGRHSFTYFKTRLLSQTAALAKEHQAVCVFVNDCLDGGVLEALRRSGVRFIALRSEPQDPSVLSPGA